MSSKKLYKIIFTSQGKVYEVYANQVSNSNLLGFIEIEDLIFGERSKVVIDPSEEKIQSEFKGVKRTYIPMHSVIRVDEVDKQGVSKISKAEVDNVTQLPNQVFTPNDTPNK